jgi:cellulose synthase/poly-beta-1,6-N-acetylglucosamine synthase-like glycosyltransferase
MAMQPVSCILLLILAIACFYYLLILLFFIGMRKNGKQFPVPQLLSTTVAVIIPARNEEDHILNCLNDLLSQDYPRKLLEVVVVDDRSDDETGRIIRDFIKEHPDLSVLLMNTKDSDIHASKKGAIELAVSKVKGTLILGTDADTRFGKNWISSMVACYEQSGAEMILGPVAFCEDQFFFTALQSCEFMGLMAVTDGSCGLKRPLMCNGANLAYSRKAFEQTGGFSENKNIASGDDLFLMMNIRKRYGRNSIRFNRSAGALVVTDASKTLRAFIHQRLRWVSKSRGYKDPFVILVAIITYLLNASLFGCLVAGIFFHIFWIAGLSLFCFKLLIELPLLYQYARFLNKTKLLKYVPLVQLLNIFYVTLVGLGGLLFSSKWKKRTINPLMKNS